MYFVSIFRIVYNSTMTFNEWLQSATRQLTQAKIETARLDSIILIEHVTKQDRALLLADPNRAIESNYVRRLNNLLKKRAQHVPIAYLLGHKEFYGRGFKVSTDVMVPRPETEAMIDMFKQLCAGSLSAGILKENGYVWRAADIGTGSGAIGITASLEVNNVIIDLIDVSDEALDIARTNVVSFSTANRIIKNDLLKDLPVKYDILLCNLPYVPDQYAVNRAASFEPRLALFGGHDGLDIYRRLFSQVATRQVIPLYILTEALPFSHLALEVIARKAGMRLLKTDNFIQLFTPK